MSGPPPPPPPPHGESPKTTGLPPGKYDVFIIPEHSAGSGFLYLPSLRTNTNSFVAGFASALVLVVMFQSMAPAFQAWWANFQGMGNMGMMMLVIAVGLGAWSLGRQQQDGPGGPGVGGGGSTGGGHTSSGSGFHNMGSGPNPSQAPPPPPPNAGPPPNPPPPQGGPPPGTEKPKPSWQQRPAPQPGTARAETPKNSWERAREETRRREEERKAKEEEQKRKEAAAQRLRELREKEAREREQREKERQEREAREREAKEKKERDIREAREREQREKERREREQREKEIKERLEREAKEREEKRRKEEEERQARKGSSYAFSGVGEKTNPWPNGKPPVGSSPQPASPRAAKPAASPTPSPTKKPPPPTARTFVGTDDDAYSFRPYDKPKRPTHRKSNSDLSESSWAPSQSTARTTPPPSVRGPYTTKDPDKIVIKAVYCFMNQYAKTPASQLISGVGSVTDGLILRITTEGLFIDDDVRNVPQREWDVKAWTLKAVETGDWKAKGLHLLRATIRDQEGKRYLFVVSEEESWKVAVGLQRLRRGTQVRALGVGGLSGLETKSTLETLGWV